MARMWVVMQLHKWDTLRIDTRAGGVIIAEGLSVSDDPSSEGVVGFLPVFGDYDAAVAWAARPELVYEIQAVRRP